MLQHVALVLADPAEYGAAAAGTGAGRLVGEGLARQLRRQRLAHRMAALTHAGLARLGTAGRLGLGGALGRLLLQFADQQLELLDVAVELFRRPAKSRAPQHGQLHLEFFNVQRPCQLR